MYKIPANTLFIGKNLVFVPECHSTNDLAQKLTQQPSAAEGSVIITANQTAGRGQRGNTWVVEPGKNLTLSIIIKPAFVTIKEQFYLNIVTSLALYDYLGRRTEHCISIKWPNDILVHRQKICGVLIENQLQGSVIKYSVVGIGLNINQKDFSVATATSLSQQTGREHNLEEELHILLESFEARYLQLRNGYYDSLKSDYLSHLYWKDESHTFGHNGETFTGTIRGIDTDGKLQIETRTDLHSFDIKEVTYIK